VETLTATTRAIPTAAADARIIDVTPATIDAALATAEAGDVLRLGDGTYGSIEGDERRGRGAPARPDGRGAARRRGRGRDPPGRPRLRARGGAAGTRALQAQRRRGDRGARLRHRHRRERDRVVSRAG
jgi:hypothetical protein